MNIGWMLWGTILMMAAHCIRAVRTSLLLDCADSPRRSSILFALCLAYAVNALLPLRAGDVLRAAYMRLARPPASRLSTARAVACVGVERMTDLAVVGPALLVLGLPHAGWTVIGLLIPVFGIPILSAQSRRLRIVLWRCTAPLSHSLRLFLMDCIWSIRTLLVSPALRTPLFALLSLVMWVVYFCSYALLAAAVGGSLQSVVGTVYGSIWTASLLVAGTGSLVIPLVLAPVVLLLVLLPFRDVRFLRRMSAGVARRLGAGMHEWFDQRFHGDEAYRTFLLAFFSGGDEGAAKFGLAAIGVDGSRVRQFMQGGSGAVTALVDVGLADGQRALRVRKFALGEAADRLLLQASWLEQVHAEGLPATPVMEVKQASGWASYDMPYLPPCATAYDAVHAMSVLQATELLRDVLATIRLRHAHTLAHGDVAMSQTYARTKIASNARLAVDILHANLGERWTLNGAPYSLDDLQPFLDPEWAVGRMNRWGTMVASIHGDLTMENIVVSAAHPRGWFLIDPNPRGVFDRALLDMGKLLQSLHLGYENLSHAGDELGHMVQGGIVVPLHRSEAYAVLHAQLVADIIHHDGEAGLREAMFHEFVHYLRLIPYKVRRSPMQATAFAALAAMLGRHVLDADHQDD